MIVFEPHAPGLGRFVYDADLGFRVRPNMPDTNEFGFNDVDYPHAKPEGTIRIVVLGDSFSWAGGDLNYVDVLRGLVREHYPAAKIDVINAGYPMTHTGEQLEVLRKYALQYDPDVVVLSFFAGNDFSDGDRFRKRLVLNDCFYDVDRRDESFLFGYPMVGRSRLWTFINQKLRVVSSVERVKTRRPSDRRPPSSAVPTAPEGPGMGPEAPQLIARFESLAKTCPAEVEQVGFTADAYLELVARKMKLCDRGAIESGQYDDRIRFILGKIDAMKALLDSRGIAFHVGIFPDEYQISRGTREAALAKHQRSAADFEFDLPQRILRAHLERAGIPSVDFLPYLRRANELRPVCYPRDSHYNYYGNAAVAHVYFSRSIRPLLRKMLDNR
jgi:hypothetical protein